MINSATLQHTIGQNIHSVWYATERELVSFFRAIYSCSFLSPECCIIKGVSLGLLACCMPVAWYFTCFWGREIKKNRRSATSEQITPNVYS